MTTKNTDKEKILVLQAKTKALEWLLGSVEFYIRESTTELSAEARTKNQEYRWWKYNLAVGRAVRMREIFPDCSKPPMSNPDPLNGLHELNDWVIKELKNTSEKTGAKSKSGRTQRKKTPVQLLRETRERHTTKILADYHAKGERITSRELGKMLGCNATTVCRLKAWQKQGTLGSNTPSRGFNKQNEDDKRPDYEAYKGKLPAKPV